MLGRLKYWRRVATRYGRCPKVFLSVIALAALVIYWLWVMTLSIDSLIAMQRSVIGEIGKLIRDWYSPKSLV